MHKSMFQALVLAICTAAAPIGARSSPPALDRAAQPAPVEESSDFVVHEWGTFTTFSGSDGISLEFRPLAEEHNDLPAYVQDRGSLAKNPEKYLSKRRLWGRVRMETPVTYFYTDRVRTVDVRVDFPQGLLTEFYPPVSQVEPPIDEANIFGKGEAIGNSSLSWNHVDLIPEKELVPAMRDVQPLSKIAEGIVQALLPHAPNEEHYAAARDTDSAIVHVRNADNTHSSFEKFLFYRGVGKFELPITAAFANDSVVIQNGGDLPVRSAIFVDVRENQIVAAKIDRIEAGQQTRFDGLQKVSEDQLADLVRHSLVAEGLYEKEAAAMVATWQKSWFTENGSRVLYIVPQPTTNALLPLHITPPPQKMVRVLVGRMEIMSPTAEEQMSRAVAQSAAMRAMHNAALSKGQTKKPYSIPNAIRNFGRMAEPALVRVATISQEDVVRQEAAKLIAEYRSR